MHPKYTGGNMEKFNFQQSHILATHLRLIFSRKSYCVLLELFVGNTIKNWNKVFSKKNVTGTSKITDAKARPSQQTY